MYNLWNNETNNYNIDSRFLTRLNITLSSNHCSEDSMNKVLEMIGKHYGYDRINIINIHPDRSFTIPYEWCQQAIIPLKSEIRKSLRLYEKGLEQQLNTHNYIHIQNPEELASPELKEYLQACGTAQVLLLPLFSRYSFSFIAFSKCDHANAINTNTIPHLEMLADTIATNMEESVVVQKLFLRLTQTAKISPTSACSGF